MVHMEFMGRMGVVKMKMTKDFVEKNMKFRKERRVRKPSPHKGKGVLLPSRAKIVKASL